MKSRTFGTAAAATAALLLFAAPVAVADDESTDPSPAPSVSTSVDACADTTPAPAKNGKGGDHGNGNGNGKSGDHGNGNGKSGVTKDCRDQQRTDRAELRDQIRSEGGSWGSYVRQATLLRVATKLAERYGEDTTSASLGRILTLINSGLPEAFQIDVEAFLAEYDLTLEDIVKVTTDDDEADDETDDDELEPSPSPSEDASEA